MVKQDADATLTPIAVANYLLRKGFSLSPLKLIKLVYLCHSWHIAMGRGPLLSEPPQAWQYGPMLPTLYYAVRHFGHSPVRWPIPEGYIEKSVEPSRAQAKVIDKVLKLYEPYTDERLATLANSDGTPWHKVWLKQQPKNAPIPDDVIYAYFEEKLNGTGSKKSA